MIDFVALMEILSRPRPNGSPAERETVQALGSWLDAHSIPYTRQKFRLYPYYFEAIGLWLIASRSVLAWAVWSGNGWAALIVAVVGLIGATFDASLHVPVVTWPGARQGENILVEFGPPLQFARQEIVISAHYDSKTELLDHVQRMFFLRNIPTGLVLTLVAGLTSPAAMLFGQNGYTQLSGWFSTIASICAFIVLILSWGYGLNLVLGRLVKPSQGAVDNGAACAILLDLVQRLHEREAPGSDKNLPPDVHITLALFAGEEVDRQGSRAFVRWRGWSKSSRRDGIRQDKPPVVALNLEVMAQDGDYLVWEREGSVFGLRPTSAEVNRRVIQAVQQETGTPPQPGGPVTSDGASFLEVGIPTAVLGTCDKEWGVRGFHRPADCLNRVVMKRLPEGTQILLNFIDSFSERRINI